MYFFAIWKLGAVVVPFDRETNPEGRARILEARRARLIIAGYGERPAWANDRTVAEWWEPGAREGAEAGPAAMDAAGGGAGALYFTSGTTGTPKGA